MYASNRWLVVFWKQAQIIHTVSASFIWIITIIISAAAINKMQEVEGHLHNILGVAILSLVSLVSLQGFMALGIRIFAKWNQDIIRKARLFHKVVGIFTTLLA